MTKEEQHESGKYFSISDHDYRGKESRKARIQRQQPKKGFMDRAKEIMDDSPLGNPKGLLDKILNRPTPEEETPEYELEEHIEQEPEEIFYDYDDPESIQVGYIKPGTETNHKRKSISELKEERFDLKMGALSGLLSRFGAEGVDERPEETVTSPKAFPEKQILRKTLKPLHQHMSSQIEETDTPWLLPDLLYFLAQINPTRRILEFVSATLFAQTEENYMTDNDQIFMTFLLRNSNLDIGEEQVRNFHNELFLFPDRLLRLYQDLLDTPLEIPREKILAYKSILGRYVLQEIAQEHGVAVEELVSLLSSKWQQAKIRFEEALKHVTQENHQFQSLQQRGMKSSTLFAKLVGLEETALHSYRELEQWAQVIYKVGRTLTLTQAEEEFNQLKMLQIEETTGNSQFNMLEIDIPSFETLLTWLNEDTGQRLEKTRQDFVWGDQILEKTSDLSPVNQKKFITMAKNGEYNSLITINSYKITKISQTMEHIRFPNI